MLLGREKFHDRRLTQLLEARLRGAPRLKLWVEEKCLLLLYIYIYGFRLTIMENQMEKKMENEMETGIYRGLYRGWGFPKLGVPFLGSPYLGKLPYIYISPVYVYISGIIEGVL